jgi:hypothetical protein
MANKFYPKFKENALKLALGVGSVPSGTLKAVFIDTADYTYSDTHDMLNDVAAGSRVGTATALSNITYTNGVLDSDTVVFSGVTGDVSEAAIFFLDTGVESTSPLVLYYDSATSGLPLTPNGSDVNLNPNASGWGEI